MSVLKVLFVTLLAGTLSISVALFGQQWIESHPDLALNIGKDRPSAMILPDLRLTGIDGQDVDSHGWAGKVLVMHFWASWCAPCLAQVGPLERLQARHDPSVLRVVGIAIDSPAAVRAFLSSRSLNYQVLLGGLPEIELATRFGNRTRSLPFLVLFDRQGRAQFNHAGPLAEEQLKARIEALLPKAPPTPSASAERTSGDHVHRLAEASAPL